MIDLTGNCPSCKRSWKGKPMTNQERIVFGPVDGILPAGSCFSLLIGREDPKVYDGVCAWVCPHCGKEFPRPIRSYGERKG